MFKPGDRVRRKATGEECVVTSVRPTGMVALGCPSGSFLVPSEELELIIDDPIERLLAGMLAHSTAYGLRLQAQYLRHAYRYDPLAGLSNARIEPTPHQVYVAHRVVNKLRPRMILADEVGLGKTIEAGLILKELSARNLIDRVLIVVPASLQHQWQHELESKFNERFEIVDGPAARFLGRTGDNPWSKHDRIICSINLAANRKHADNITELDWDLIVFDEAHRVRRSLQSSTRTQTTQAYELADELKETATGLLLLSATPMQLHPFELYSLIELVEPGLFVDFEEYDRRRSELPHLNRIMKVLREWEGMSDGERERSIEAVGRSIGQLAGIDFIGGDALADPENRKRLMDVLAAEHPLTEVLARNRKAEVGGFTPRHPSRILVTQTVEEAELYEDVSEYLRHGYERAQAEKRYAVGFLMVLYQRLLTSSSMAVRTSFKRRIIKLRGRLAELMESRDPSAATADDDVDLEELRDWEEPTLSLEELEQMAIDEAALELEIDELSHLVDRLGKVRDSKAGQLVRGVREVFRADPDEKVLIFTQYIETQNFLAATLRANGIETTVFNGTMTADQKEAAVQAFRRSVPVMISTEAGGEGRNFQFCHIMFNYDLPWNPMKVEQRIGRLDRIGQKRAVYIYNLAAEDTVEERILEVLDQRIGLFVESVGSLDPILGEIERDIERIVLGHAAHFSDAFAELGARIEDSVRRAREAEKVLGDFILDRASFRRDVANELLQQRPMADHGDLRRFLADNLAYHGGRLDDHPDGGSVIALSPRLGASLQTRSLMNRGVFDWKLALEHEDLPFLAMGQPLVDSLVGLPLDDELSAGARALDDAPSGVSVEIFYEIQAEGFARRGTVIRHVVPQNLSVTSVTMNHMPDIGREVTGITAPHWAAAAVEASRTLFDMEHHRIAEQISIEHNRIRDEELERAKRIHDYRRARLERIVSTEEEWIFHAEQFGDDKDRRIMPARKGKLAKNRERLHRLNAEFEAEAELITAREPGAAARVLAAGLVVGRE